MSFFQVENDYDIGGKNTKIIVEVAFKQSVGPEILRVL